MLVSAGLTDSASHYQADVECGDQVFADLQRRSCKPYRSDACSTSLMATTRRPTTGSYLVR